MSDSVDWTQFYNPTAADSTAVSTAPGQTTAPVHSTIEGRVGKSNRRRTRASRRAPTTLLNTDPTNFRAMVQQFTGAPAGPYTTGPVINFGVGFGDQIRSAPAVQYGGQQQFGEAVFAPGGDGTNNGLIQGFNGNNNNNNSSGFFLDGMGSQMVARGSTNERMDGYFL